MDMRIIKTKKSIKESLIRLLNKETFEKITVSEICREGITSRITFYTYYRDKYALINEIFRDYFEEAANIYRRIREQLKKENRESLWYEALLESILHLYYDHAAFFSHTDSRENPYLFSALYNHVSSAVDGIWRHPQDDCPERQVKQTTALLFSGLFGMIHSCVSCRMDESETRRIITPLFRNMLSSMQLTEISSPSENFGKTGDGTLPVPCGI